MLMQSSSGHGRDLTTSCAFGEHLERIENSTRHLTWGSTGMVRKFQDALRIPNGRDDPSHCGPVDHDDEDRVRCPDCHHMAVCCTGSELDRSRRLNG